MKTTETLKKTCKSLSYFFPDSNLALQNINSMQKRSITLSIEGLFNTKYDQLEVAVCVNIEYDCVVWNE